ncbi:exonuclease domain-containing protein [Homoserinimonas sp. OAct 916]|uniref:exonuclease domain-containing protein n=1 Tax=Homoserinimonas sp. OAct 916 TaxID=2211450 RepID=UPI000DBE6E71|nr:exonuclease domain-containing protein [Homoserinimonas sp. OAct 916]
MSNTGFAVVDVETTGLFPGGHDRIVEIAVVHVDANGIVEGQWDTLVNPGRDLGPQRVHRVRAADVMHAPTFAQIAPRLAGLLSGRVLVAHNASFDTRFLLAEFERSEVVPSMVSLCTMRLARDFLPGAGRALADRCAAFDIDLVDAHRASADALATAQLLCAYMKIGGDPSFWQWHIDTAAAQPWPALTGEESQWLPRESAPSWATPETTAASFLERITVKLPEYSGPVERLDYLALLDRCLLDRSISAHEAQGLVALAEESGLGRDDCEELHLQYFNELVRVAWSDGILTPDEMADISKVGDLLAIPSGLISETLGKPIDVATANAGHAAVEAFTLVPGDLVVLTGEMARVRSEWEAELSALGFVPWSGVTKTVKLLVAADPDSLSGKARKARDYNIPVVDETGLRRLLAA